MDGDNYKQFQALVAAEVAHQMQLQAGKPYVAQLPVVADAATHDDDDSCTTGCGGGEKDDCTPAVSRMGSYDISRLKPGQGMIRACTGVDLIIPPTGGGEIDCGGATGIVKVEPGGILDLAALNCLVAVGPACGVKSFARGTPIHWSVTAGAGSGVFTGTPFLGANFAIPIKLPSPQPNDPTESMAGILTVQEAEWTDAILGAPYFPTSVSNNGSIWLREEGTTNTKKLFQFGSDGTKGTRLTTTIGRGAVSSIWAACPARGIYVIIVNTGGVPFGTVTLSGVFLVGTYPELSERCRTQDSCSEPPWTEILGVADLQAAAQTVQTHVFKTS